MGYDSIYGGYSLYTGCANTLILTFDTLGIDRDIRVWSEGSGAEFVYETDSMKSFKVGIQYLLPAYETSIVILFDTDKEVENGSQFRFISEVIGGGRDTTDIYYLYAKSEITLEALRMPTRYNHGILDISAPPYMQRSLDNGLTWEFALDTITGEPECSSPGKYPIWKMILTSYSASRTRAVRMIPSLLACLTIILGDVDKI